MLAYKSLPFLRKHFDRKGSRLSFAPLKDIAHHTNVVLGESWLRMIAQSWIYKSASSSSIGYICFVCILCIASADNINGSRIIYCCQLLYMTSRLLLTWVKTHSTQFCDLEINLVDHIILPAGWVANNSCISWQAAVAKIAWADTAVQERWRKYRRTNRNSSAILGLSAIVPHSCINLTSSYIHMRLLFRLLSVKGCQLEFRVRYGV